MPINFPLKTTKQIKLPNASALTSHYSYMYLPH